MSYQTPPPSSTLPSSPSGYLVKIALVLVLACGGLFVLIEQLSIEKVDEAIATPTEDVVYEVKPFASAAETLKIEAVEQWNRIECDSVTIFLPQRLMSMCQEEAQEMLRELDPQHDHASARLFVADEEIVTNHILLAVHQVPLPRFSILNLAVEDAANELRNRNWTIDDTTIYQLGDWNAGRVIYSETYPTGESSAGVLFIFLQNDALWRIQAEASGAHFPDWLPIFEVIAREFEIN